MSGDLLSCIDDNSKQHALSQRLVLPKSTISAGDGLFFVFESLPDAQQFLLDLFFRGSDSSKSGTGFLNVVITFDIPVKMLDSLVNILGFDTT